MSLPITFFTSLELAETLRSWNLTLVGTVRRNNTFLSPNMQPSKDRPLNSTNFAFRKRATLCSYVPKKKKAVILLSTMHYIANVEQSEEVKPEIIAYYNQTKGGVDTMDKMLLTYTVKRKTSRWPLAPFYNTLDVSTLATYIIYKTNNPMLKGGDVKRSFLKDLAKQLCMKNIEARMSNQRVVAQFSTRSAIEHVLGHAIKAVNPSPRDQQPRDDTGRLKVVGSCYVCRQTDNFQRKTRKACETCLKPICLIHSVQHSTCLTCSQLTQN